MADAPANAKRFGRAIRDQFPLAEDGVYLNHGTVGVTPHVVMRARAAILDEIERHPARFLIRDLIRPGTLVATDAVHGARPRLRAAAERVARFLGTSGDSLVFVDNASSGVNAVLRSVELRPGDEVLVTDHSYGGVVRAAGFLAAQKGAVLTTARLPFPARDEASFVRAIEAALTPRTRLAILDHVTSETALVLPLAAMAEACRSRGVAVLVDGAHAPGAIEVDLEALGVDWYVANLHKWAFAPRACGVLYAAPARRRLHPTVLSWGLANDDWLQEFDWTGTRDPSPWLAAPAALDFMADALGVAAMREWNHRLAWQGAVALCRRWGREWTTPETLVGCMVTLPLPEGLGAADAATAQRLRDALLVEHGIEAPVVARDGALWLRLCAQVYNDEADIDRLAVAIDSFR